MKATLLASRGPPRLPPRALPHWILHSHPPPSPDARLPPFSTGCRAFAGFGENLTPVRTKYHVRGLVGADPIGALAHVQSGRALVLSGDTSQAKAAYQDFLTLWKDADPDIPILKQAKAEYAGLQ